MKIKVSKSSKKKTKYELLRQELYSKIDEASALLKSHFQSVNNNIYDNISALQDDVKSHQDQILKSDVYSLTHLIEHAQSGIEKCFERIEEIESQHFAEQLDGLQERIAVEIDILKGFNIETQKGFNRLSERIDKLENQIPMSEVNCYTNDKVLENMVEVNVKNLHDRIDGLDTEINTVRALGSRAYHPKKPYKCPVCEGNGHNRGELIKGTEFEFALKYAPCNSCEGKGVVWG